MYSQSRLLHRTTSTANILPYDVLREIFLYCPPASLDEVQPNPKIAPMSFCHVCSSWRTAAMESPHLWSHLYKRLPIRWRYGCAIACNMKTLLRDMECLRWWRGNLRSRIAPFIRLEFYQEEAEDKEQDGEQREETSSKDVPLTGWAVDPTSMNFLAKYLSSAQYLDIGRFARHLFRQDCEFWTGYSNLQFLVTRYPNNDEDNNARWQDACLLPFTIVPTLQRLCIHDVSIPDIQKKYISDWSRLTHLSLQYISFRRPHSWHHLIRAVPNLQWGYFNVHFKLSNGDYDNPHNFTLSFLSTLSVTLDRGKHNFEDPLVQFFNNLHLPSLHDLSIYTDVNAWSIPGVAAARINDSLKCMPAVTKLTLGLELVDSDNGLDVVEDWNNVENISTVAPLLTHLLFDMRFVREKYLKVTQSAERPTCWDRLLDRAHWLDLRNPASVIRKITAILKMPSKDGPLVEAIIRGALKLDKEEHGEEIDCAVKFEIAAGDKGGLSPDAEGWKTWGSSL